jgi:hypothetical protein
MYSQTYLRSSEKLRGTLIKTLMTLLCLLGANVATVTGDAFGNQIVFVFLCYKRRNLERSFKKKKNGFVSDKPFYFKIV